MDKIFSPIKSRILQYIDFQGVIKNEFYQKTSISPSNFKGTGAKSEIGGSKIVKILTFYPDINPIWLLTGKGSMLLEKDTGEIVSKPTPIYKEQMPTVVEINPGAAKTNTLIADVNASAGFGVIADNHQALEELPAIHLPNAPQGLNIAFQINGDSMEPSIRHMDFVAGNQIIDIHDIRDGQTYVIVDERDGVLCKRISHLGSDWQITSDNPVYKPYNRAKGKILAFYLAFCRWSYDFTNKNEGLWADVQQLKLDINQIKQKL